MHLRWQEDMCAPMDCPVDCQWAAGNSVDVVVLWLILLAHSLRTGRLGTVALLPVESLSLNGESLKPACGQIWTDLYLYIYYIMSAQIHSRDLMA